jgi:hypothetical protein
MRMKWTKMVAILLIPALLLLVFPSECNAGEFSDNSSEGAAITIGLFAAILAVLFIVSFKTDVDNVFSKNQKQESPKQDDSLADNVSLVLVPPRTSPTEHNLERCSEMELASGLNVGVRVQF